MPNTSGSATTTGETRGEGGEGGGRDDSVCLKKRKEQQHFVWKPQAKNKMHSSGLKRLNQTPTPVYTGIYSGASRRTPGAHAPPRAHTPTPTHTPTNAKKKTQNNEQNGNLKTLQKNGNTSSRRINKNLHKTRHIL